jgi:hypothetical protein
MEKSERTMKTHLYLGISVIVLAALFAGCSELKDKNGLTPTAPALSIHGTGWDDSTSADFHGAYLKSASFNAKNCQECHAPNYQGGTSGVSCFKCHTQYPHSTAWLDTSSTNFHGATLKATNFNLQSCQPCHSQNFQGGTSGVSCYTCHSLYPHASGWSQSTSAAFHGAEIMANQWNMNGCKTCHGTNYNGIATGSNVSCMSSGCHVDAKGNQKSPEACNTCHGTFNAPANNSALWAPPRDVNGNTATTSRGVGAHQGHLQAIIGKVLKCQECHTVPAQVYAAGHFDYPLPARVVLNDTLANLVSGNGTLVPHPAYNATQLQCNNTFCHGNWQVLKANAPADRQYIYVDSMIVGANYSPTWTGGINEAACGKCHGLPPKGHLGYGTSELPVSTCGNSGCHAGVVDENGKILDPTKHINGKIDYEMTERNF